MCDVLGREVGGAIRQTYPAGEHDIPIDGTGLAPGLYVVRIWPGRGLARSGSSACASAPVWP